MRAPNQRPASRPGVAKEFYPEKFTYDAQQDIFLCPAGEILRHKGRDFRRAAVAHQYRAATEKCRACEFRSKCCPGNVHHGRSLIRTEEPPSIRQFSEKMQTQEAKNIYRQRGAVAEFPNAWIKEKLGLRQFRLRGLVKVGLEVLWAALTYNIQQWARLSWLAKLTPAKT